MNLMTAVNERYSLSDGRRQPWELPLAGIEVTLNGQSVTTDEHGRFVFHEVAPDDGMFRVYLPVVVRP